MTFGLLSKAMTLPSPAKGDPIWTAAAIEAVNKVESILPAHIESLQNAVVQSITAGGNGLADLVPYIEANMGLDAAHSKWLATELTSKTYASANKLRMLKLGLKQFMWLHTGGGNNPFSEHIAMSGQIYNFDEPPIINSKTGQRGFPSDLPGCRCRMNIVLPQDWS